MLNKNIVLLVIYLFLTSCNYSSSTEEKQVLTKQLIHEKKVENNIEEKVLEKIEIAEYKNHNPSFDIKKERKNGLNIYSETFFNDLKAEVENYIKLWDEEKDDMLQSDKIIMLKSISYLYSITSNIEDFPNTYDENFSIKLSNEADLLYEK